MPLRCSHDSRFLLLIRSLITYLRHLVRPCGFEVCPIPSLEGKGNYEVEVDNAILTYWVF